MRNEDELPSNWKLTTVGEICREINYGYTASASEERCGPKFLRITDIQNGDVNWKGVPYCNIDEKNVARFLLKRGDIVFARTGGTVGKSYIIKSIPEKAVFASYLIRLTAFAEIFPAFLYHYFQSASYWEQIGLKKGGLQGNVNATTLSSIKFPICSLNEQKRIVAKIEELFSELDKGIENLKIVREQLKVYRQAVLKQAFEGRLTAEWREKNNVQAEVTSFSNQNKVGPIIPQDLENFPALPTGWRYQRLGLFIKDIEAGKSFKCDEREPTANEIGVAKVSAVTWGEYNEAESKTCIDSTKINPAFFIKEGDFLFSRANTIELVGTCVIVEKVTKNVMLSDKTLRIQFLGLNPYYFLFYLWSHSGRSEIMHRSTGNQESMRNIGQERIRNIIVPACTPEEAEEIRKEIQKRFSIIKQFEETIDAELKRSESLRQSILKKAFSGKLVVQDPNDEHASILLERIRVEKESPVQQTWLPEANVVKEESVA